MEERVYVIKMGYYYYVGKSKDPKKRLEEHQKGEGAEFTKIHQGAKMELLKPHTNPYPDSVATWERLETLYRMNEYGIKYVRGSTFSQVEFTLDQEEQIRIGIRDEIRPACFNCGKQDHLQKDCPNIFSQPPSATMEYAGHVEGRQRNEELNSNNDDK